jgi:hypothetical protein
MIFIRHNLSVKENRIKIKNELSSNNKFFMPFLL